MERSDEVRSQLVSLAVDVLDEVCQTRRTESAVALTDDLIRRRRILRWGDPLSLVALTLRGLNYQGLVVYAEREEDGIPIHIRATDEGFRAAGYRLRHSEAGRHLGRTRMLDDGSIMRQGDRTDFRTHSPFAAVGIGPIETMPLREHVGLYPDHAQSHWAQLAEMERREMPQPRKYTDAQVERAVQMKQNGSTYVEIEAATHIPRGTLSGGLLTRAMDWNVTAIPTESIRTRLLAVVGRLPRLDSVDLTIRMREDGRAYSLHEVQHVLGRLHRQGLVTMIQEQNGRSKTYRRIELARPQKRDAGRQDGPDGYRSPARAGSEGADRRPGGGDLVGRVERGSLGGAVARSHRAAGEAGGTSGSAGQGRAILGSCFAARRRRVGQADRRVARGGCRSAGRQPFDHSRRGGVPRVRDRSRGGLAWA